MSPALAGGFLTTVPPGKSPHCSFDLHSLIISAAERLFMCLLAIRTSLQKCLFKAFAHFKIRLFVYFVVEL